MTTAVAAATQDATHVDELRLLEAEAVHIIREVVAELQKPVLLFSAGKDSIVLLRLAEKAFRPSPLPFPVLHVDTGHNFPEVIEFRDRRINEHGHTLIVGSVQETIDSGRSADPGRRRVTQPPADPHAAGRAGGRRFRRRIRRRPSRRGAGPRQRAHPELPRRVRPVGSRAPSGPSRGRCTTAGSVRASRSGCSRCRTGPRLDIWRYIELEGLELPPIYFAHEREVLERDGILLAVSEYVQPEGRRNRGRRMGAVSHGRRPHHHRCGALPCHRYRRRHRPRSRRRRCPSAVRPAPTTGRRWPRWKTASVRGTSDERSESERRTDMTANCCASPPPDRWMTARAR